MPYHTGQIMACHSCAQKLERHGQPLDDSDWNCWDTETCRLCGKTDADVDLIPAPTYAHILEAFDLFPVRAEWRDE